MAERPTRPLRSGVGHSAVGAGYNPPTAVVFGMQLMWWKPLGFSFRFSQEIVVPEWAGHDPPLRQWFAIAGVWLRGGGGTGNPSPTGECIVHNS